MKKNAHFKSGFTIVELIVSIAIFAFMTAFLLAKYGTFNQSILLTNVAYDAALAYRTAQTYGLNVKSTPDSTSGARFSNQFNFSYGIHADKGANKLIFYADGDDNKYYTASSADIIISTYTLQAGMTVQDVKAGDGTTNTSRLNIDITFKRPNPDAVISIAPSPSDVFSTDYAYGEISLGQSSSGLQKKVIVRKTGQISVSD